MAPASGEINLWEKCMDMITIFTLGFNAVIWAATLPFVGLLAGIFIYKFRQGWAALWITLVLQLVFSLVFSDVFFYHDYFPAEAAAAGWRIVIISFMVTGGFGLVAFPILFFLIHGNKQQRVPAVVVMLVVGFLFGQWFYPLFVERHDLDFNVNLHGQILDLDGRGSYNVTLHLGGCERYESNPVMSDSSGMFRIRASCPERLVVSRIDESRQKNHCLTRTETSDSIHGGGVVSFVNRKLHRDTPQAPFWGDHGEENPYRLTCIWESPYNHKDARGSFSDLVADGRVYSLKLIANSKSTYLRLYDDGRSAMLSLQLFEAVPGDGNPGRGRMLLRAVEGGIQPTDDRVFNIAPKDGYAEEVEMDLGDMQSRSSRHFYFHTYQRQAYGVIEIDFDPREGRRDLNAHMVRSIGTRTLVSAN